MSNDKLKEKIQKVSFAIFCFFFWYLVIGFFLKSDYPIYDQPFNRLNAYEILRDGLTLSAYFLAPAIAYVLFSDWREQHVAKELESNSKKIYENVRNISFLLFSLKQDIEDEDVLIREGRDKIDLKLENVLNDIIILGLLINNFDLKNSTTNNFVTCSNEIKEQLREEFFYIDKMFSALFRANNPREFNTQYDETDEQFSEYCRLEFQEHSSNWFEAYANYIKLEKELEKLKEEFRIKI